MANSNQIVFEINSLIQIKRLLLDEKDKPIIFDESNLSLASQKGEENDKIIFENQQLKEIYLKKIQPIHIRNLLLNFQ